MSLLKKHWQKFVLASFASFWAGCGDEASSDPVAMYGCPSDFCKEQPTPESSESLEPTESSFSVEIPSSSEETEASSSNTQD